MKEIWERAAAVLYPPRCLCCGTPVEYGQRICIACEKRLKRIEAPYCVYCGTSLKDCTCAKKLHAYTMVAAPFYYEAGVRDILLQLKYGGKEDGAKFLAEEMGKELRSRFFGVHFDMLTCVPTSMDRIVSRGYNQARSLAEQLREDSQSGFLVGASRDFSLLRKRPTRQMQHFLGASGRRANIQNAFCLQSGRDVRGKTILLIDDIVTTGATVQECATVLKLQGARDVYVGCAAITRKKPE